MRDNRRRSRRSRPPERTAGTASAWIDRVCPRRPGAIAAEGGSLAEARVPAAAPAGKDVCAWSTEGGPCPVGRRFRPAWAGVERTGKEKRVDTHERPEDRVRTASRPSELKITDLRTATVGLGSLALHDRPHRHQPGHQRLRRGARFRQQDLRADAQEPPARREPLQRGQALPQDQAVRPPRAAGRRRLRRRDGADGPGRQGLRRAGLRAGRRQVPRPHPHVLRHAQRADRRGHGQEAARSASSAASPCSRWTWASSR